MKNFIIVIALCHLNFSVSAPTRGSKEIFVVLPRFPSQPYNTMPYPGVRGPFDFIGNWIQSSEWFPIEINVPDSISNIGTGLGNFASNVGTGFNTFTQNVGTGFQTFTQNVGNNFQNFAQNLSQRFPVLAVFVRPNGPTRYFVLVPKHSAEGANESSNNEQVPPPQQMDSSILESFP